MAVGGGYGVFRNAAGAPRPQGQSQTRPAMSGIPSEGGGDEPKLASRFRPLAKFVSGSHRLGPAAIDSTPAG